MTDWTMMNGYQEAFRELGSLEELHADSRDMYPLNAPGLPPPGPDFIALAVDLGDTPPTINGKGDQRYLVSSGPELERMCRDALYIPNFGFKVRAKGQRLDTKIIPGHIWGSASAGPRPAEVMIFGKWPGDEEMSQCRNLCGPTGQLLAQILEKLGVMQEEYYGWYASNLVKHPNVCPSASRPAVTWFKNGAFLLAQELRLVRPKYLLCLGAEATEAVLGKGEGGLSGTAGRVITKRVPVHRFIDSPEEWHEIQVMTCTHPAAVLKGQGQDKLPDVERAIGRFVELVHGRLTATLEEDYQIHALRHARELSQVVERIIADPAATGQVEVAIDCEWHGAYPTEPGAYLRTIQFSVDDKSAYVVVFHEQGGAPCFFPGKEFAVPWLRKLFLEGRPGYSVRPRIIGHNFRADLPWLILGLDNELGLDILDAFEVASERADEPIWELTRTEGGFDTMLAAHAVHETEVSFSLDMLALVYCRMPRYDQELSRWKTKYCKEHKIKAKELAGYGDAPDEIIHPYSGKDTIATFKLFKRFNGELLDCDRFSNNCRRPFWIAMRATHGILEMETTGLLVDRSRAELLSSRFVAKRTDLLTRLQGLLNWPKFNPNSHQQCSVMLFGPDFSTKIDKQTGERVNIVPAGARTLGLVPIKTTGKRSRSWDTVIRKNQQYLYAPSTDKEVLGSLATRLKGRASGTEAEQENKPGYQEVVALRNLRFITQVCNALLGEPARDASDQIVVNEQGDQEFEKGIIRTIQSDGRIRTHISQNKETRRYSSWQPNLQALSKRREASYQQILGKDYLYPIRTVFEATPGYVFVEADYKGAELFTAALQSGDEKMLDHCLRANLPDEGYDDLGRPVAGGKFPHPRYYDIHSSISVKAFCLLVDSEKSSKELKLPIGSLCPPTKHGLKTIGKKHLRDVTKTLVFGALYGRGDAAIVRAVEEEGTQISLEDAALIRAALMSEYPKLGSFFDGAGLRVAHPGWLRNCFGSYRRFSRSDISSRDDGSLEREAGNFPIQSSVADAVSRALDYLYHYPCRVTDDGRQRFRLVLQIHDAILFEVHVRDLDWFLGPDPDTGGVLQECMSNLLPIYPCDFDGERVPGRSGLTMGLEYTVSLNWGEAITREAGLARGVPERFLPQLKQSGAV